MAEKPWCSRGYGFAVNLLCRLHTVQMCTEKVKHMSKQSTERERKKSIYEFNEFSFKSILCQGKWQIKQVAVTFFTSLKKKKKANCLYFSWELIQHSFKAAAYFNYLIFFPLFKTFQIKQNNSIHRINHDFKKRSRKTLVTWPGNRARAPYLILPIATPLFCWSNLWTGGGAGGVNGVFLNWWVIKLAAEQPKCAPLVMLLKR